MTIIASPVVAPTQGEIHIDAKTHPDKPIAISSLIIEGRMIPGDTRYLKRRFIERSLKRLGL